MADNMRLIDADALVEELFELKYTAESPSIILTSAGQEIYNSGIESAIGTVLSAPTVDAPRKGEWLQIQYSILVCSECKKQSFKKDFYRHDMPTRFCPHCGAKMDGDADD